MDSWDELVDFGNTVSEALAFADGKESEVVCLILAHVEARVGNLVEERGSESQLLSSHVLHGEWVVVESVLQLFLLLLGEQFTRWGLIIHFFHQLITLV